MCLGMVVAVLWQVSVWLVQRRLTRGGLMHHDTLPFLESGSVQAFWTLTMTIRSPFLCFFARRRDCTVDVYNVPPATHFFRFS